MTPPDTPAFYREFCKTIRDKVETSDEDEASTSTIRVKDQDEWSSSMNDSSHVQSSLESASCASLLTTSTTSISSHPPHKCNHTKKSENGPTNMVLFGLLAGVTGIALGHFLKVMTSDGCGGGLNHLTPHPDRLNSLLEENEKLRNKIDEYRSEVNHDDDKIEESVAAPYIRERDKNDETVLPTIKQQKLSDYDDSTVQTNKIEKLNDIKSKRKNRNSKEFTNSDAPSRGSKISDMRINQDRISENLGSHDLGSINARINDDNLNSYTILDSSASKTNTPVDEIKENVDAVPFKQYFPPDLEERIAKVRLNKKLWNGDNEAPIAVADKRFVLPEFCYTKAAEDELFNEYYAKICQNKEKKIKNYVEKEEQKDSDDFERASTRESNDQPNLFPSSTEHFHNNFKLLNTIDENSSSELPDVVGEENENRSPKISDIKKQQSHKNQKRDSSSKHDNKNDKFKPPTNRESIKNTEWKFSKRSSEKIPESKQKRQKSETPANKSNPIKSDSVIKQKIIIKQLIKNDKDEKLAFKQNIFKTTAYPSLNKKCSKMNIKSNNEMHINVDSIKTDWLEKRRKGREELREKKFSADDSVKENWMFKRASYREKQRDEGPDKKKMFSRKK